MKIETKGMIYGFLGIIAFGLTLPMTKMITPYLNPIFIGLGRSTFAAIIALILLLIYINNIPTRKQIYKLGIVSIGVVVGFPVFTAVAMQSVPASHGAIVIGILPLFTAISGSIIAKEKPSLYFWLLSLIGTGLVVFYTLLQGSGSFHKADIYLFMAVLFVSVGYAVGGKLSKEMGGWQVICWAIVISFPFIVLPTIYYAPKNILNLSISTYIGFLYLSLISQLLGFFLWYKGLSIGGIARVSQVQLLQIFITIIASYLLLEEVIDTKMILFAVLVVLTVGAGKKMPIIKCEDK